ncbi:hypothetical protein Csa_023783, partial [Cucumis sativus]
LGRLPLTRREKPEFPLGSAYSRKAFPFSRLVLERKTEARHSGTSPFFIKRSPKKLVEASHESRGKLSVS